jgi:hypothetical protein
MKMQTQISHEYAFDLNKNFINRPRHDRSNNHIILTSNLSMLQD